MSDTEILVDTIEAQVNTTREVDTVTQTGATVGGIVHVPTIEQESIVEVKKSEYSIVGDGLYASVSAEEAPAWLMSIIDTTVDSRILNSTQALSNANQSILNALDSIDIAKNSYQELINISATVDQIISSRLQSLDSTLNNNNAKIVELQSTMVTPSEAMAMTGSLIQASINGGAIGARIGQVQNTFVNEFTAMAFSIDTLDVQYEDISSAVSTVANTVQATADKAEANFAYNAQLTLNGTTYNSGFGLATSLNSAAIPVRSSEFWIKASKLRFTDANSANPYEAFTYENGVFNYNGAVSFNKVTGTESLATKDDLLESYYYKVAMDKYPSITDWDDEWYITKGAGVNRSRTSIGGKTAILFGDDAGDDNVRMVMAKSIPYNPAKVYKISLSYYYTHGVGHVRAGFVGRDGEDSIDIRSDGSSTKDTGFYCTWASGSTTSVWHTISGYIGGSTSGLSSITSPITSPLPVNTGIKYIRPYIEVNRKPILFGSSGGRTYIADFTIEEVTFESMKATSDSVNASIPTTTTSTSQPPNPPTAETVIGSIWRQGPGNGTITDTDTAIIPMGQYMHYQYDGSSWKQIGGTYINGSNITTGTINAGLITSGVIKADSASLSAFTPPADYSGTVMEKDGISVYNNGVLRVRLGKLF